MVVGPNGSGKSNLVDAIIWVLGEQGPASLRSAKMEDVIFAGTATKAPLGMAEVQLTIDNSAGILPVEYTEVCISRTLFRSGDSEYRLNGDTCRLLDIQELLSDAGVGKEQHTIVGQGRIDEVLSADAVQMRGFIEDAAGVGKHRRRKERALRKIQASEANLDHLEHLLAEIRRQLRPLRQQAELAEKHQRLVAELHQIKLVRTARELAEVGDKLGPADSGAQHSAHTSSKELELAALDARLAGVQDKRQEIAACSARHREVQWRLKAGTDRLLSLKKLADERQRTLSAELAAQNEAVEQARLMELQVQLSELEAALPEAVAHQQAEAKSLMEARAAVEESGQRMRRSEEAVAVVGKGQAEASAEATGLRRNQSALTGSRQAAETEAKRVAERLRVVQEKRDRSAKLLEEAALTAKTLQAEHAPLTVALEDSEDKLKELDGLATRLLEEIRGLEKESAVHRARAGARASAALTRAARVAGLRANPGVLLLSDLVDLAPGHQRALEALVGPLDGVVVAEDEAAAAQVLTDHNPDDAITVLVSGRLALGVPGATRLPSAFKQPAARAEQVLADVYLAPSLAEAITLAGKHRHAVFITTGGALAMGSFVSRGSREIAGAIERCESQLKVAQSGMAELQEHLKRGRLKVQTARAALAAHTAAAARATEALRQHERRLHGFEAEIGQLEDSSSAILKTLGSLAELSNDAVQKIEAAEAAASANEAEVQQIRQAHARARRNFEAISARADEARVRTGVAEERRRQLVERIDRGKSALAAANRRLAGLGVRQQALLLARDRAASVSRAATMLIEGTGNWAEQAGRLHGHCVTEVEQLDIELADVRTVRTHIAAEIEQLRAQARKEDLGRSELQVRVRILQARLADDLHADPQATLVKFGRRHEVAEDQIPQDPLERASTLTEEALLKRQVRLERELEQMGQVNPLAAREAETLAEREEFLATQMADVKASRKDLREIIETVDDKIKVLFTAAFEDVAREYEQQFQILFPNGRGRLTLTDPTELLESGVEVEASPQGKNLKRLSLLSGGEKALSALALLFSIFKARPSPFYILDEVEAALDDVNLQRFLGLLHEFRGTSQLLVVSHQKRTMEIADVLYGVAVRPDGASKVISERLSDLFPASPVPVHERGPAQ